MTTKVLYAIPSRGRWNRMLVLKYLPKVVLSNLHIFVITDELEEYLGVAPKGSTCVPVPDWVDHIERKRLFMFQYAKKKGYDAVFMFDDDLSLAKWNPKIEKFRTVRDDPEVLHKFFAETVPALFDKAPGVGLGCKFMADGKVKKNGLLEVNGKMCCAFGYRVEEALKFIEWEKTYHLWNLDTMANLFFLANGLPLITHYGVTWSTDFGPDASDPKKGGCAIYRKQSVINEAFLRMLTYFPGLVVRKKKMGTHPTSFLQIKWKDAYGHFLKMGEEPSVSSIVWAASMKLDLPGDDPAYYETKKAEAKASVRLELALQGKGYGHLDLPLIEALDKVSDVSSKRHPIYSRLIPDLDKFLEANPELVPVPKKALETRKSLF